MTLPLLFLADWIDTMPEAVKCWPGRDPLPRWLLFEVVEMHSAENERESDGVGTGGRDPPRASEPSGPAEAGGLGLPRTESLASTALAFDGHRSVNLRPTNGVSNHERNGKPSPT